MSLPRKTRARKTTVTAEPNEHKPHADDTVTMVFEIRIDDVPDKPHKIEEFQELVRRLLASQFFNFTGELKEIER